MPASSSKDPYRLKVFIGSFWPFSGLFPPPLFFRLLVVLDFGRDAAGFSNSAACTHVPATFTFAARTWRHRSGLGAQKWTLTQPPGSKSGALGKHRVQHQETQNSCPLSTRTRTVPGRPGGSLGTGRYRSGTARNKYNRMDSLLWSVRRNPVEICLTDHRFNQFFSC